MPNNEITIQSSGRARLTFTALSIRFKFEALEADARVIAHTTMSTFALKIKQNV